MSLFGFTSVAGIALGPFLGSVIVQIDKTDPWRWIFYIQIIYNAGLIPVFWLILRETRGDVILARRAKKLRRETGKAVYAESELTRQSTWAQLKVSFHRPARMLTTEPVVIFFTLCECLYRAAALPHPAPWLLHRLARGPRARQHVPNIH